MDNALKLLIGVLSIAGLLAFLAPTNVTPPAKAPVAAEAAPAVTTPTIQNADAEIEEAEPVDDPEEDEPFTFGEPTIDGKPLAGGDDNSSPNNDVNTQSQPSEVNAAIASPEQLAPADSMPVNQGQ